MSQTAPRQRADLPTALLHVVAAHFVVLVCLRLLGRPILRRGSRRLPDRRTRWQTLDQRVGPSPLVDAVRGVAQRRRAAPERIRADAFDLSEPERRSLWQRTAAWGSL